MPTKQKDVQQADQENQQRRQLNAVVGDHVIQTLGRPAELREVQVRRLWAENYRVNVLVGADAASVKVAHSYFLVTDSDGKILASTPKISRCYPLSFVGSQETVMVPPTCN